MVSETLAVEQATARPPPPNRMGSHISEISDSQVLTAKRTAGTTTTAQRGKNYSAEECCMLANAYLSRSTDGAIGTNQTEDTFWNGVSHGYNLLVDQVNRKNTKKYPHRTQEQLQGAWKRMQKACNKFIAICRQNPRGSGDRDDEVYYKKMRTAYRRQNNSNFSEAYLAAYKYLRKHPKWSEKNPETVGNCVNEKDTNSLSAVTTAASSKKRPIGRDSSKMERSVKRASTTVAKNISAAVGEQTKALLQKIIPEITKARVAQEAATNTTVLKYASAAVQQAYADTLVNKMKLEAEADRTRAELKLVRLKDELANAKRKLAMTNGEDEALNIQRDEQRSDQEDERVEDHVLPQEHREGSPKNDDEMQDEEDGGGKPQQGIPIDVDDAQSESSNSSSDGDSHFSLESEVPSVKLEAGDKIQYWELGHVGRREFLRTSEVIEVDPSKEVEPLTLDNGYALRIYTCGHIRKVSGPDTRWRAIEKFVLVKSKTKNLRDCMFASLSRFEATLQRNMRNVEGPMDVLQDAARPQSSSEDEDEGDTLSTKK